VSEAVISLSPRPNDTYCALNDCQIISSIILNMFAKSVAIASVLSTAFAGLAPLQPKAALPDVTIKALPAGCASFPQYDADAQTAGPWSLTVPASENPDLLNFGPSASYSLAIGAQGRPYMRWGYVSNSIVVLDRSDLLTSMS
jgi:hypothetical protein